MDFQSYFLFFMGIEMIYNNMIMLIFFRAAGNIVHFYMSEKEEPYSVKHIYVPYLS